MTSDPAERYLSDRLVAAERKARLRPMMSNEIIDQALGVYRALGGEFLRRSALPSLFCLASVAFFSHYVWPAMFATRNPDSVATQVTEAAFLLVLALLVGGPLFLLGVSYTTALVVQLVSDYLVGERRTEYQSDHETSNRLPALVMVVLREAASALWLLVLGVGIMFAGGFLTDRTSESSAVAGVVTVAGVGVAFLGVFVCLWVLGTHALVVPVAVLEKRSIKDSVRRSSILMKASNYHPPGTSTVVSLYALMFFVALVLYAGSAITFGAFGLRGVIEEQTSGWAFQALLLTATDLVPTFLMVWSLVPLWAATVTVIYYERRIRLEGFDIDVLARDL